MKFQNEYHRLSEERKMKKIAEWQKHPANLEEVLENQRRREQQAREMEEAARERRKKEMMDTDTAPGSADGKGW